MEAEWGVHPMSPWKVGPYALVSGPPMSRRSLRPQLNQIRGWVRQGRTDAWIAHQLEVTVQQIQAFKREQGLEPDAEDNGAAVEEVDLRAEDDALIAAELEEEAKRRAEEEARAAEEAARKAAEEEARAAEEAARRELPRTRTTRTTRSPSAPPGVAVAALVAAPHPPVRSRARSTMARRATACGWTPPSRTTRSTPSTGRATAPSRSRSRKTRS